MGELDDKWTIEMTDHRDAANPTSLTWWYEEAEAWKVYNAMHDLLVWQRHNMPPMTIELFQPNKVRRMAFTTREV